MFKFWARKADILFCFGNTEKEIKFCTVQKVCGLSFIGVGLAVKMKNGSAIKNTSLDVSLFVGSNSALSTRGILSGVGTFLFSLLFFSSFYFLLDNIHHS